MSNELFLVSPMPPSVNNYMKYRVARSGRRLFVQTYPTAETVKYRKEFSEYVKNKITETGWIMPDKDKIIYVECYFYINRKRKDANNLFKVMLDVLTECGVYYDDDNVVPVGKRIIVDKYNPRIELTIKIGDEVGVFKDAIEYGNFLINNCDKCTKKSEKCTILRDLKNNKLSEFAYDLQNCGKKKNKRNTLNKEKIMT